MRNMEEKKSPEFKINIDAVHSDHFIREEKKDNRIEKLNQKITIISIIFPCIIILLLLIIYFDIKNKITGVHDSGSMEIQNLTNKMDKNTDELTSQYLKLQESLEKKTAAHEIELQNSIKDIKETKAEKTEIANSTTETNKRISALKNDISVYSNKIKGMEAGFSQKIADIVKSLDKIENDIVRLNSGIAGISASKADKKDIETFMRNEQKRYQNELNLFAVDIEEKFNLIRRQMVEVEKKIAKTGITSIQQPKTGINEKSAVPKGASSQSGKIVEQDLQ